MKGTLLEKYVVTELDMDRVDWHDATIHGLAFASESFELVIDLDYIVKWVSPDSEGAPYRFWVTPATLVFQNVYDLHAQLEPLDAIPPRQYLV